MYHIRTNLTIGLKKSFFQRDPLEQVHRWTLLGGQERGKGPRVGGFDSNVGQPEWGWELEGQGREGLPALQLERCDVRLTPCLASVFFFIFFMSSACPSRARGGASADTFSEWMTRTQWLLESQVASHGPFDPNGSLIRAVQFPTVIKKKLI